MYDVRDRIRQRRIALGLSQTELAHRMGLKSRTSVCKDEKECVNITSSRLIRYAKALNCTEQYLLGREDVSADTNADIIAQVAQDVALADVIYVLLNLENEHRDIVIDQIYSLYRKEHNHD